MIGKCFFAGVFIVLVSSLCLFSCDNGGELRFREWEEDTVTMLEAVDLGLTVKWANMNLGANRRTECGGYYGWGCTEPYADGEDADWELYFRKIGGGGVSLEDCGSDLDPLSGYLTSKYGGISGSSRDAAYMQAGGEWRMPTWDEVKDLDYYCRWSWTSLDGVMGYKVMNRKDSTNYIFLPAVGYREGTTVRSVGSYAGYWSGAPHDSIAYYGYGTGFHLNLHFYGYDNRCVGFPIRPVRKK